MMPIRVERLGFWLRSNYSAARTAGLPMRCKLVLGLSVFFCPTLSVLAGTPIFAWGGNSSGETNVPAGLTNVIAIAGGSYHFLALRSDGSLAAWGSNSAGQTNVPTDVTNVVGITAGETHSLALRPDGTVRLWGTLPQGGGSNVPPEATNIVALGLGPGSEHPLGLRGDGTIVTWGPTAYGATNVPPWVTNSVAVAAGGGFHVALRADGSVTAWGDNTGTQLNVPSRATNIVAVSAGWNHVVGLRSDGTLLAWGCLSSVWPPAAGTTNIIQTMGGTAIIEVASGANHFLALKRDGTVLAYGGNGRGQINVPRSATNIAAVAGTVDSSIAVVGWGPPMLLTPLVNRSVVSGATAYFRVLAFGARPLGYQWQMNGTNIPGATNSVLAIPGIQPAQAGAYSITVSNPLGMVSSPDCRVSIIPLLINAQPTDQAAYVGQTVTFSVVVAGQGPLSYQWQFNGSNITGATSSSLILTNAQLGDGGAYSVMVSNGYGSLASARAILAVSPILITQQPLDTVIFRGGAATLTACALAQSALAYQWSFNGVAIDGATGSSLTLSNVQYGQTGRYRVRITSALAAVDSSNAAIWIVPVAAWGGKINGLPTVPGSLSNVTAIAAGGIQGMALHTDGAVSAWHGKGDLFDSPADLTNAVMIAAGTSHRLALRADGTVVAWGVNIFGLTDVPEDLTNAISIATAGSGDHNLVIRADGTVVAWGLNTYGQINVPLGLSNVVAVAGGFGHSLALRADGTVCAWGYNGSGQATVPQDLSNVVAIAAGDVHSLALRADGTVVGWGSTNWNPVPSNLRNVVAISAGHDYSLTLRSDGTVTGAGYTPDEAPFPPAELQNVVAIASGNFFGLALIGDGPPALFAPIVNPTWTTNVFSISFPTHNGKVYALQYKNSLLETNWSSFPLMPGTGKTQTVCDPAPGIAQRFYRVRQW